MKRLQIACVLALMVLPGVARAAEADLYCWVSGTTFVPCSSGQPVPFAGTIIAAPLVLTPVTASTAVESNHVLKNSAGTFYGVQVNTTTSSEWVMLFNLTALPSNGAVTPFAWWQVPANTTLSISENPAFTMSNGIVIGCSTTGPFTLTASALCTFAGGQVQ